MNRHGSGWKRATPTKTLAIILFTGRLWVHTFRSPDERAAGKATVVTDVTVAPVQIAAFPGI